MSTSSTAARRECRRKRESPQPDVAPPIVPQPNAPVSTESGVARGESRGTCARRLSRSGAGSAHAAGTGACGSLTAHRRVQRGTVVRMPTCCDARGCDQFFGRRLAGHAARRYRKKGLERTAQRLVE